MLARCALFAALLAAAAMPAMAGANTAAHFDCRVTGSTRLEHLGRDGQAAELSQFTCNVRGGLLDGFVASGTNIWEPGKDHDVLLGSIVFAQRAGAAIVYEVQHATRAGGHGIPREGVGRGLYKLATGSAAPLAGKSFRSVARAPSADTFTLDIVIDR